MPIYDYVCTACGTRVEVMHGVHDAGPTSCVACGGLLRKALSPPAIVFRGSGWAKKDARAAAQSDKSTSEGDGQAQTSKTGEGKSADGSSAGAGPKKPEPAAGGGSGRAAD